MHIESSITAVSWIPVGSVTGLARVPFSLGVRRYDGRPPARIDDLDAVHVKGGGIRNDEGELIGETTDTNFGNWFATYYGTATPWGGPDLEPLGLQEIAPQVERAVA